MPDQTPIRGEFALIEHLREALRAHTPAGLTSAVPFGDDMAQIDVGVAPLLATTDMLMDGVDFVSGRHPWHDIGRKALAVNLSDCAAMAAVPLAALCSVALNDRLTMDDARELLRGLTECGRRHGCLLVGGDTNSWASPTVISVTVVGRPEPGLPPVRRDGARPGDHVFVTGPVGGSILGRHLDPQPRIALALALNRALRPHAMIDISDGLAPDLRHILEASGGAPETPAERPTGCGAVLDAALLDAALHADAHTLAAQDGRSARDHGLYDGEDFELIVVLGSDAAARAAEFPALLPLGRIVADPGLRLCDEDGTLHEVPPGGWEHFR